MTEHPCETCLRWEECNGVDAENCPVVAEYYLEMGFYRPELWEEIARRLQTAGLSAAAALTIAAEEIKLLEREPVPRPEKNTVRKSYRAPLLPIRRQARSKLK